MTLLDIRNQLITHFCSKNVLHSKDIPSFSVEPVFSEYHDKLIRSVLSDLVSAGMIREIESGENSFWILTQPVGLAGQEVSFSLPTCVAIALTLNAFNAAQNTANGDEDSEDKVDALDINEGHIIALLEIINYLRATGMDEEEE